jgi:hypothetical protein
MAVEPQLWPSDARGGRDNRERLALIVVIATFLTIALLIVVTLGLAVAEGNGTASKSAVEMADKTFTVLLPVLSGWVSVVLTFYFQARALDRTQDNLQDAVRQITGAATSTAPISGSMIPFASIRNSYDLAVKPADQILVSELQAVAKATTGVTRLLFHESGVFRHILHVGTLDRYVATLSGVTTQTFADILRDPALKRDITELIVFADPTMSLTVAKAKLEAVLGAQDIIVTSDGKPSSTMRGWLSNNDLLRALS